MLTPAECRTKEQIRSEIDRLDGELIALFAERFAYVQRMAELKREPSEAHHQGRIEDVLNKVEEKAAKAGLDAGLMREIWRQLVEWNVAWERAAIAARIAS